MPRRGENIFKRKDGRWEGRYKKGRKPNGRTIYGSVYARSYKSVKEKLEQKRSLPEVPPSKTEQILFEEISGQWLRSVSISAKESTVVKYRNLLKNHILAEFGSRAVSSVSTVDLENFARKKLDAGRLDGKGGLSPKTVGDMLCVIHEILNYAKRQGMEIACSTAEVHIKKTRGALPVISRENQMILEQYLLKNESPRNTGILICLRMGLRIGEICALKWENILIEDQTIRIRSTMQRVQDIAEESEHRTKVITASPKSDSAARDLPIPDFLAGILKQNRVQNGDAYFLTGSASSFVEPRLYQSYFSRLLKEVQIPYINFHALRHTFATRCIEAGMDAKTLSELLGHSKVTITLERYVHITMEMKRKSMEKVTSPQLY